MTAVVIYSVGLDPLTVIDIAPDRLRDLETGRRVRMRKFDTSPAHISPMTCTVSDFELYAEFFNHPRGGRVMFVITNSDSGALSLKAALLPGQEMHAARCAAQGLR